MAKQDPWPPMADTKPGWTLSPNGYLRSDRPLAGPLRLGTAPGVGPGGRSNTGFGSDFGTDRITPKHFDPMGTSTLRAPEFPGSSRVASEVRRAPFKKSDAD